MSEWTVVTVVVTLVGLGAAILRPLISLNSAITRLTQIVQTLEKSMTSLSEKNSESHERLWKRVGEHDDRLNEHEKRLSIAELARAK